MRRSQASIPLPQEEGQTEGSEAPSGQPPARGSGCLKRLSCGTDTHSMQDSWSYGEPAQKRPSRPNVKVGRPLLLIGGAVLAAVLVFVMFQVVKGGAKAAGDNVRTQLSQVDVAGDRDAQSSARNAVIAAKVFFADNGSYSGLTAAGLTEIEPSLNYVDATQASADPQTVSVYGSSEGFGAAVLSGSGTCFWLHDSAVGVTTYGSGTPCTGRAAMAAAKPAW